MIKRTHARELNGFVRGPLTDSLRPYAEQIRMGISTLDGGQDWAYRLWRIPEGVDLARDVPRSDVYLQCAGSAARLTIEWRVLGADGEFKQWVLGKAGGERHGEPAVEIPIDNGRHTTHVYPCEVFTADEAADIFYEYFLTDTVSEKCSLRELDLS